MSESAASGPAPAEELTAVVLAGGLGTRLRAVVGDLPKPMAPVLGRPFLDWVVGFLRQEGVRRVVISAGYRAEIIEKHFAAPRTDGVEVIVAREPSPMGTAGGFRHALRATGLRARRWLVLNGDSLAVGALAPLLALGRDKDFFAGLLGVWMDDAARYGSLDIDESTLRLRQFLEKRPGAAWINAGVYLLSAEAAAALPEQTPLSWETQVFPGWLAAGRVIGVARVRAPFLDIGVPEDLGRAEAFLLASGLA
jgi:D-glycero-alpha-D-manno-heptose 1-phosphate guanylyltransferase